MPIYIPPFRQQRTARNQFPKAFSSGVCIENNLTEIERLLPFYRQLALPTSLTDMHLQLTEKDYQAVAERASTPGEMIHLMKETITPERIICKMKELETLTSS